MKFNNLLTANSICSSMMICLVYVACSSTALAQMAYPISVASDGEQIVIGDLNLPGVWLLKEGKATKLIEGAKIFKMPLNRVRCVAIDKDGKVLVGGALVAAGASVAAGAQAAELAASPLRLPARIFGNFSGALGRRLVR